MNTITRRALPVNLLPESVTVYNHDGDYGTYVRYTDGSVSVFLGDEDESDEFTALMLLREDVAHAETIIQS